jgi:ubiquinone/menaquinone biosynthesis C-methylase UbiE
MTRLPKAKNLHLLPREALIPSGVVDHADWNYRPVLGWIQQLRFRMAVSLLPRERIPRLLEVGYGSGIFMPQLALRCRELYGIDVHPMPTDIARILAAHGVRATLYSCGAESLPFEDGLFDAIVAVSSLEFVEDINRAGRQMARVLRPDGNLVMVTPGHSPLLDAGLRVLTGESAERDYGGRREALMPALFRYFRIDRTRSFPIATSSKGIYTAFRLRKLKAA